MFTSVERVCWRPTLLCVRTQSVDELISAEVNMAGKQRKYFWYLEIQSLISFLVSLYQFSFHIHCSDFYFCIPTSAFKYIPTTFLTSQLYLLLTLCLLLRPFFALVFQFKVLPGFSRSSIFAHYLGICILLLCLGVQLPLRIFRA